MRTKGFFRFLFPKQTDEWLALLRVGLGLQLFLYCLSARLGWIDTFSGDRGSLSPRRISEALVAMESSLVPRLTWFLQLGERVGISEFTTLWMIWSLLLLAASLLIVGLFCRPAAVTAWLLHLACIKSSEVFAYGMDLFLNIGLFYLMLTPLPDSYSLENRIWQPTTRDPRMIGFFRRVLQLHLCAIYFFSGLAKCLGTDWWNGLNLWAALTRPPFNILDPRSIAEWHKFLPIAGITVCLIEISYPVFMWCGRTRRIWLGCVVCMHVAIALTMGMYLFGLIMIVLNVAAFGPAWGFAGQQRAGKLAMIKRTA